MVFPSRPTKLWISSLINHANNVLMKARPPMAKNRTIPRMVGNVIPNSADTTPCAPPIIAATISPIGPKNIPNMAQRQPWSSLPPSFISFIAHLPSAPQISQIALHRRLHRGLRTLLLLHRGKSSSLNEAHALLLRDQLPL